MSCAIHEHLHLAGSASSLVVTCGTVAEPAFAAVLFPPHPELGGAVDHPLLRHLAEAIAARGGLAARLVYPRPDRRAARPEGPSLSEDRLAELISGWEACRELLGHLAGRAPVFGFGCSLGAHLALLAAEDGSLADLVLAAPPIVRQSLPVLKPPKGRTLFLLDDDDLSCPVDLAGELASLLGPDAAVEVLPGNGSLFAGGEDEVAARCLAHWQVARPARR